MSISLYFDSLKIASYTVDFFAYLIDNYGEVNIIKDNVPPEDIKRNTYHDFIYFCFTKSCRSLYSAINLAEKGLREDSLIILRTVYENYLHLAHILNDPLKIQEYVVQTVGLSTGNYKYKIDNNGRRVFNRFINVSTQKEHFHGTSNALRAKLSFNKIDSAIHSNIYSYLSEHIHPNMNGSGNYRNSTSTHYNVEPIKVFTEVPFLILYICFITFDAIHYYHSYCSEWNVESMTMYEAIEFSNVKNHLINGLLEVLKVIKLNDSFKELILKRINSND